MKKGIKNFGVLTSIIIVLSIVSCSQSHRSDCFEIDANINGLEDFSKAYIQVSTDTGFCYIDSVNIQGSKFQFDGKTDEPMIVTLWIKEKSTSHLSPLCSTFYLENSVITVSGDIKKRGEIRISGSDAEKISKKIDRAITIPSECLNLQSKVYLGSNADSIIIWRKQLNVVEADLKQKLKKAIKANSSSYVALHTLLRNKSRFSNFELSELAKCFPDEMHSSQSYKSLMNIINDNPTVNIGEKFMDFSLLDSRKQSITLSQFKSKLLMVDFWASWCGPCRRQFKSLKELYTQTNRSDFDILGISLDHDPIAWNQALESENVPWVNTIVPDKKWAVTKFLISSIPYNYILDSNGVILAKNLTPTEIKLLIDKYCEL